MRRHRLAAPAPDLRELCDDLLEPYTDLLAHAWQQAIERVRPPPVPRPPTPPRP